MTDPIVIVPGEGDQAAAVDAAGTAAVQVAADAFRQGVNAAEDAARQDYVTRAEFEAALSELRGTAAAAVAVADDAAEAAIEAAAVAVVAADVAAVEGAAAVADDAALEALEDAELDDQEGGAPRAPEPRSEAPAPPDAPKAHKGYGAGWLYGKRG